MDIMDIRVITVIKDITDIMVIMDIRNYAECISLPTSFYFLLVFWENVCQNYVPFDHFLLSDF